MKTLPNVSSKFGAPMGRYSEYPDDREAPIALTIQRLRWVDGDYDEGGAYWGAVENQYVYWAYDAGDVSIFAKCVGQDKAEAYFKKHLPNATFTAVVEADLEEMVIDYVRAALFTSTDADEVHLDSNYCYDDMDEASLAEIRKECQTFLDANRADIEEGHTPGSPGDTCYEHAGRDFWYSRNGHGVGFWDGDWPKEAGKRLHEAAKDFGEASMYVEGGKVYYHE